jgi:hypothetical protein
VLIVIIDKEFQRNFHFSVVLMAAVLMADVDGLKIAPIFVLK